MACRNIQLAEQVAESIRSQHPGASIIVGPKLDLSSQQSVRDFASEYIKKGWPLHCLVNNAGAIDNGEPWYTPEGIGGLCQINYLGPFTLTRLLEQQLIKNAPSRVVNVSSITHRFSYIGKPETFLTNWKQGSNYGNTKLANALFAFESERRLGAFGVHSCAVDPGSVGSSIWENNKMFNSGFLKWAIATLYAPSEDGAAAIIHAACVPWEKEKSIAAKINERWNIKKPIVDSTHTNSRTITNTFDNDKDDVRFYARGMFSWPTITSFRGVVNAKKERSLFEKIRQGAYGLTALVHSGADWPVRRLSGGKFVSVTRPVPAAPLCYDKELATKLWEVSCEAAKLPLMPLGSKNNVSGEFVKEAGVKAK
jgi:WW domain-containing oxidoreductase